MTAGPYLWPFVAPYADGFACRAVLLRPESRGHLELVSADPSIPPRIVAQFLSTERDRVTLRAGLRLAREVGRQEPLKPFVAAEVSPGPNEWSDAGLDAHIAATGITVHHPLGTCRMGVETDEMTVVDSTLNVLGVENLRVIDASVMPDMIGGNINAAVIMIAEKASDFLRGRPLLAPAPSV
jgi:4-pyridoxate dehydrogenase